MEEIPSHVRLPPRMEGCNISDVSMAEEGPQQCDSDVVVEEEIEESMEMDEPSNIAAPAPLPDKAFPEGFEAEAEEDPPTAICQRKVQIRTHPHDSDLDEDELLGPPADISIPGGTL